MGDGLNGFAGRCAGALLVLLACAAAVAGAPASALASSVSNLAVSASPAKAGAQRAIDSYTFKATSAIPALTGAIRLQAPSGEPDTTFSANSLDYVITDGASVNYAYYAETDPEGLGQDVVDVHPLSEIAAGDTITVAAYGVADPRLATPAAVYRLSTSSDTTPVERTLSIATSSSVSGLSVSAVSQFAKARDVVYKIGFKASTALSSGSSGAGASSEGGYILLKAAPGATFEDSSARIVDGSQNELVGVAADPEGQGANVGELELPPGFRISAGDTIGLTLFEVRNPPAAEPTAQFAVSTSSDTIAAHVGLAIAGPASVSAVSASATPQLAGASEALYEVGFTPAAALYPASEGDGCYFESACDYIRLQAPAGTVFPSLADDYELSFGSTHEQPWFVEVEPEGSAAPNVVFVHLPHNAGVGAGTPVHIKVWGVANPPAAEAGELSVSTSLEAAAVARPFPLGGADSVSDLAVSTSSNEAGASAVQQTVTFRATSPLPFDPANAQTSYVRLEAPAGATLGGYYRVSDGSHHQYVPALVGPGEAPDNVAEVPVPFEVAAGDTVELLTSSASNPAAPNPTGEFSVSSSSDGTPARQAYAITPASSVSGLAASLQPAAAGAKEAVAHLAFTATHAMLAEAGEEIVGCDYYFAFEYATACRHIHLVAPEGSVFPEAAGDYLITTAAGTVASFYAIVDPDQTGARNVVDVYISPEQSVAARETVQLSAYGLSLPAGPVPSGELSLSSSADPAPATTALPVGPATSISRLSFSSANHHPAAQGVRVSARFTATGPLTAGAPGQGECCSDPGYVRLTAPSGAGFAGGSGYEIDGTPASAEVDPEELGQNVVDVMVPHGLAIAAGQELEASASTLTNPSSTGAYEFTVSTSSDVLARRDIYVITNATAPQEETPPTVSGSAQRGQTLTAAPGAWGHEPTHYSYQWLRCEGASCVAITGADGQTYEPTAGDVGRTIEVQVSASNAAGAAGPVNSAPTAPIAPSVLRAVAGEGVEATEGVPVTLDASGSSPSEAITGYSWEFGDGEDGSGALAVHTYAQAGTYTATVHVSDGKSSATASTQVLVSAAPAHSAEVTVRAKGAGALAGAEVIYTDPVSGRRTAAATGPGGVADLPGLPVGSDAVDAYIDGYRPASGRITVAPGGGQATIELEPGEVHLSTVEYEQLTLGEIEAAGINPLDPANHQVDRFKTRIALEGQAPVEYSCDINSAGELLGGCPPAVLANGARAVPSSFEVEGHPVLEWLITEAGNSALKQFLDVHVVVQNLSEAGFTLAPGEATLKLPAGLSLAPSAAPESFSQSVPGVPAEGVAARSWVVRGDTPGEYALSASYEAQLEPLAVPVALEARSAAPLHVWGAGALQLTVEADQGEAHAGVPYHVAIAARNTSPVPLLDVDLAVEASRHAGFIYQPGERFSDSYGEIAPGETVRTHGYVLVPDGTVANGLFAPALAAGEFAGEDQPATETVSVAPPASRAIETLGDVPRRVHLHWAAVPGAEGYEVHSIASLAGPFSETPDLTAETPTGIAAAVALGAGATNAYVPARRGVRDYAVSAIVGGYEVLEFRVLAGEPGAVPPGLPEIGRCTAAAPVTEGGQTVYQGAYTDNKCTKVAPEHAGGYEWSAGPAAKEAVSGSFGAVKLEAADKVAVKCTAGTATGTVDDSKQISEVLTFTGCEISSTNASCQSATDPAGEIRTVTLAGEVGVIKAGSKPSVGLDLAPTNGARVLAQFSCAGQAVSLSGSVIAPISSTDKPSLSFKLAYKGKKGTQSPEGFEGASKDRLSWSIAGGGEEAIGLSAAEALVTEEPLEIKAIA